METYKGTGKITIGRSSEDAVRIEVEDDRSGTRVLVATLGLEDFARLLTGRSFIHCDLTVSASLVGKVRQTKQVQVAFERPYGPDDEEAAAAAILPFEVDGWKGRVEDLFNHHRRLMDGVYSVSFVRWVDPPTT